MSRKEQVREVARPLPIEPDRKLKLYTRPEFTVFRPDPTQAEKLMEALRESSDSVASRLIAEAVSSED